MAEKQLSNPTGAFMGGSPTYLTTSPNVVGRTVACSATAALTAGQVVALSTTEGLFGPQVVVCATNQNANSVLGIVIEAPTAGGACEVAVGEGTVVYGAAKDTGTNIAQFDRLTISATNTGTLTNIGPTTAVTQVKDTGLVVGIALAASVTTAATVDILMVRW